MSVGTVFALTLMVFAGFVIPVMALTDWDDDYSPDGTAYAYAAGAYTWFPPPYGYYDQAHEGKITEGNVIRYAKTRFWGYDDSHVQVYASQIFYLANNTGKYETYSYEDVYYIKTWTDSGYGTIPQSEIIVEIGPPGVQ